MIRGVFGPGPIVLGGAAFLLVAFLGVGVALPGAWEARAEARLPATPGAIAAFLDSPEGWRAWTPWPDSGLTRSGPERGAGAAISWSDRELGTGTFRIDQADATSVRYSVEVEGAGGGNLRTSGSVTLRAEGAQTVVEWREEGDLGNNPLMGYWALAMKNAQSTEMAKGLDRLAELTAAAADSVSRGDSLEAASPPVTPR
ncbi:MAG: SRPBCC family protein [Gemmatimonadota bacterium]|nr:SRPBCC family protein [Gemmatimonadota bacterium]MDH3423590.1 SRPBCC family protein [Gemmatimonadota bacterium]